MSGRGSFSWNGTEGHRGRVRVGVTQVVGGSLLSESGWCLTSAPAALVSVCVSQNLTDQQLQMQQDAGFLSLWTARGSRILCTLQFFPHHPAPSPGTLPSVGGAPSEGGPAGCGLSEHGAWSPVTAPRKAGPSKSFPARRALLPNRRPPSRWAGPVG